MPQYGEGVPRAGKTTERTIRGEGCPGYTGLPGVSLKAGRLHGEPGWAAGT